MEGIRTCPDGNGALRTQFDRQEVAVDEIGHFGQKCVIKLGARLEPWEIGAAPANRGVESLHTHRRRGCTGPAP